MKAISSLLLQAAIVLLGVAVLAFLLWEPHVEGRNAHATVFEIYFKDPFLAYVYAGSVPFFVALHRAFGLLGAARRHGAFSPATVGSLRSIGRCALIMIGFAAGGAAIVILGGDKDDRPQGIVMTGIVALGSGVVAIAAAAFARKLQGELDRPEGSRG